MAAPTFNAAGAGTHTSFAGTSLSVAYPTLAASDLLVLHVAIRTLPLDTVTTPSGWTLQWADDVDDPGTKAYTFTKVATGSESGSLVVSFSGTNSTKSARMYSFSGTNGVIEGASTSHSNDVTLDMPSVTTAGVDRLAVALITIRDTRAVASATGETGGDWTEATAEYAPLPTLQVQTATIAVAGTISGGSQVMAATPWVIRAFALQPAAAGGGAAGHIYRMLRGFG